MIGEDKNDLAHFNQVSIAFKISNFIEYYRLHIATLELCACIKWSENADQRPKTRMETSLK